MNKRAQNGLLIGIVVGLLVIIFLVIFGILLYNFGVFKTGKTTGVDGGVGFNENQNSQPIVIFMNKPATENVDSNVEDRNAERGYLDYTDWKKETEDQCTVYIRNTGDITAFFTVEFYIEDTNSSDERETDREKYVVPGEKESFTVSIDEDERCDYEVYTDKKDRYLGMMDDYDYYRYLKNHHDNCDDDSDEEYD